MRDLRLIVTLGLPLLWSCSGKDGDDTGGGHSDSAVDDTGPIVVDDTGDTTAETGDTADTTDTGDDDAANLAAQETFYATDAVQIVNIRLSEEQIAALEADPDTYVTGGFEWGDQILGTVGVKIRGGQAWDEKPGFTVKFQEFDGPEFIGLNRVVLDNQYDDTAMVRAVLAYEALREGGLAAPRANFAEVYVNDEYFGLYSNIEYVDTKFVKRVYADPEGDFYEGTDGADFYEQGVQFFDLITGKGDANALRAAWEAVQPPYDSSFLADASTAIDMPQYASYVAWLQAVGANEGYPYEENDYYIYGDPTTGLYSFVPWALDQAWTAGWTSNATRGFLAVYCARDTACVDAQQAASATALDSVEAMNLSARAQELYDLTADSVSRDTRKQLPTDQITAGRVSFKTTLDGWPARVRADLGL